LTIDDGAVFDVLGVDYVRQVQISRPRGHRPVCHTGPVEVIDNASRVRHQSNGHERKPHARQELGSDAARSSLKPCKQ